MFVFGRIASFQETKASIPAITYRLAVVC